MNQHHVSEPLTPREEKVLELIVGGATSREAGATLGISRRTVEFHRANIMLKFSARNVAELMRMVMQVSEQGSRKITGGA